MNWHARDSSHCQTLTLCWTNHCNHYVLLHILHIITHITHHYTLIIILRNFSHHALRARPHPSSPFPAPSSSGDQSLAAWSLRLLLSSGSLLHPSLPSLPAHSPMAAPADPSLRPGGRGLKQLQTPAGALVGGCWFDVPAAVPVKIYIKCVIWAKLRNIMNYSSLPQYE